MFALYINFSLHGTLLNHYNRLGDGMKYIKRHMHGIIIDGLVHNNMGLLQKINDLCLKDGSTYNGRLMYSKTILKNHKNPIFVNDDMVLVPTHSIRRYECIYVNLFTIKKILNNQGSIKIIFTDNSAIDVDISLKIMNNQLTRGKILAETVRKRKCLHAGIINRFYI